MTPDAPELKLPGYKQGEDNEIKYTGFRFGEKGNCALIQQRKLIEFLRDIQPGNI